MIVSSSKGVHYREVLSDRLMCWQAATSYAAAFAICREAPEVPGILGEFPNVYPFFAFVIEPQTRGISKDVASSQPE